jgi:hypothetical protein
MNQRTTTNPPNELPSLSADPMPRLVIPRPTPRPPSAEYASGWYAAAHYRQLAARATDRLIRERFYFAASFITMLALIILMGSILMATR